MVVAALLQPAVSLAQRGRGLPMQQDVGDVFSCKQSRALLLGMSDDTAGWDDLESVPEELAALKKTLEQAGFGVETVLDATSDRLFAAIQDFIDTYGYGPDNRLLFFFAGRGHTRGAGAKGYLVPVDAPLPEKDERGFLAKALAAGYPAEQATPERDQAHYLAAYFNALGEMGNVMFNDSLSTLVSGDFGGMRFVYQGDGKVSVFHLQLGSLVLFSRLHLGQMQGMMHQNAIVGGASFMAIDYDPRTVDPGTLQAMHDAGVPRCSDKGSSFHDIRLEDCGTDEEGDWYVVLTRQLEAGDVIRTVHQR